MLTTVDRITFWTVFDAHALRESYPMVHGWSAAELDAQCGRRRGVHRASGLAELAGLAGIDPGGAVGHGGPLQRFRRRRPGRRLRQNVPAGADRRAAVLRAEERSVTLITFAGLDVDELLRVRRADGTTIPGLYAVGEVIGSAAVNGNAFCSGMCLTPAMAFGRLVGRRLAGTGG